MAVNRQDKLLDSIAFIQDQLDTLDRYLPETYQLLMEELDKQHRQLMEIKIQDFYSHISNE